MHKHLISEEWPAKNYGTFVFSIVTKMMSPYGGILNDKPAKPSKPE